MTLSTILDESINEAVASVEDIKDVLGTMKNTEILRVAVMNRERTNHDTNWQRDYFYGDGKELSKGDSKKVVQGMIDIEKALKKGNGGRVTSENLFKAFMGDTDPKKYFKGMK